MPNKNKKEITIDGLAQMVQKGFDGVDKRFDKLEKKMATKKDLQKSKEELVGQISGVQNRIDNLATNKVSYNEFGKLKVRVTRIEAKI